MSTKICIKGKWVFGLLLLLLVVVAAATSVEETAAATAGSKEASTRAGWGGWAKGKISELGLGFGKLGEQSSDAAKHKITDSAAGAGEYAKDKASEAAEKAKEGYGAAKDKAQQTYEDAASGTAPDLDRQEEL